MKRSRKQLIGILVFQAAFLTGIITTAQALSSHIPSPATLVSHAPHAEDVECSEVAAEDSVDGEKMDLSRLHFSLKRLWR